MLAKLEKLVERLRFLDGLRGWGAVVVLFFHVFSDGLPLNASFGAALYYLIPFNGMVAVFVFFVVSGFSLSARYLADGDIHPWLRIVAGRYVRLVIPIGAACLIVHMVMVSGFIAPPAERLAKFDRFLTFDPTIAHLLKFSLFDVFFSYNFFQSYIGPLWTMSVELAGSFVVLLAILVVRPLPYRVLCLFLLIGLILWLAPTENISMLALFPLGAVVADCFNRGWITAIPRSVAIVFLSISCLGPIALPYSVAVWGLVITLPLILGCVAIPEIRNYLSGATSAHLGKISFPLYLMHGPVLYFLGEPLIRHFGSGLLLKVSIQIVVVVLSFFAAYAFWPINEVAIGLAHRFAKFVTGSFFVAPSPAERR